MTRQKHLISPRLEYLKTHLLVTGLDFAGPLYDNEKGETGKDKVYVCLFTCASTQGVHIELTKGLDVDNFLLALRRFAGRRGLPATIISDNARTFKSSAREVAKITRSSEVLRYLANNRTTWKFIIEKAPWWGDSGKEWFRILRGAFERQ